MWKASEKEIMKTYRQPRWYCECKEEKKKKCRNCFIRVHGNCRYVLACLFGKRFKQISLKFFSFKKLYAQSQLFTFIQLES